MASTATKLLETAKQAVKGECTHEFPFEGPLCPCCAEIVPINAGTANVRLLHGQRIFFCDESCKSRFLADPSSYLTLDGERISQQSSQKLSGSKPQGEWLSKKDYEQFAVWCPGCNSALQKVDSATPRVYLLNGQTLFFRCYECVANFLRDPQRFFAIPQSTVGQPSTSYGKYRQKEPCEEKYMTEPVQAGVVVAEKACGTCKGGKFSGKEQGEMITPGETCPECKDTQKQGQKTTLSGRVMPGTSEYLEQGEMIPPACGTCKGGKFSGKEQGEMITPGETCPECKVTQKQEGQKQGRMMQGSSEYSGHEWSDEKIEHWERKHHHSFKPRERGGKVHEGKALCPGCGNDVSSFEHDLFVEFLGGQRIFFCSEKCINGFAENPTQLLKTAKSFRQKELDPLNLDGFVLTCPICRGPKMVLSTSTPRVFFNHGQSLFFDNHDCINTFCASAKSYVHSCPRAKAARKQVCPQIQKQETVQPEQRYQQVTQKVPMTQGYQVHTQAPSCETHEGILASIGHKFGLKGEHEKVPTQPIQESSPKEGFLSGKGTKYGLYPQPELPTHHAAPTGY